MSHGRAPRYGAEVGLIHDRLNYTSIMEPDWGWGTLTFTVEQSVLQSKHGAPLTKLRAGFHLDNP